MREIKFRTSHSNGEGFYKFTYWEVNEETFIKEQGRGSYKNTYISSIDQFTGRKDVNGKDIYDGDILKHHGVVKWCNEFHQWTAIDLNWNDKREVHDLDYLTSPFEIIGNIHENPELIAEK